MTRVCNFGRTGSRERGLAWAVANLMLVAGLVSTNQVLGANLLGNSGIESGNFTNWIVFGADNYVSPGTRPRHNEQRPADTALQNEPLFRCGCGQPC